MRIALLGPPGAGKSTQADNIAARYQVAVLSLPVLLRKAILAGSAFGRLAKLAADTNQVPPDEVVLGVMREHLESSDVSNGFVLAGCPRTLALARGLDALLAELKLHLEAVLVVTADVDELMERVEGRRSCRSCGQLYNVYIDPPIVEGVCDECGGRVRQRPDEKEEVLSNRIRVYEQEVMHLINYYRTQQRVIDVEGGGNEKKVFKQIDKALKQVMANPAPPPKLEQVSSSKGRKRAKKAAVALQEMEVSETEAFDVLDDAGESIEQQPAEVGKAKSAEKKAATKKKPATKPIAKRTSGKKTVSKKIVKKKAIRKKAGSSRKMPSSKKKVTQKATKKKAVASKASKKVAKKVPQAAPKKKIAKKSPPKKRVAAKVSNKPAAKKGAAKNTAKKSESASKKAERKPSVLQKARSAISKTVGRVTGRKKKK